MLLESKNAVVYGAGGSMGGAVARAFAREGAHVFLAGRTLAKLDAVAGDIAAAGGAADTAQLDAHAVRDRHRGRAAHNRPGLGRDRAALVLDGARIRPADGGLQPGVCAIVD